MFASSYFGKRYFGERYFGDAAQALPLYSVFGQPPPHDDIDTAPEYRQDDAGWVTGYNKATQAGADFHCELFDWDELEPTEGNYDFTYIDRWVDNTAGLPLFLTIAVIGTGGTKNLPADLSGLDFDDPDLIAAFNNMLTALAAHLDGRLWILSIGNESDHYLAANPGEIAAYGDLLAGVKPTAKALFGCKVTSTFSFSAIADWTDYNDIHASCDWGSLTYYFTANPPADDFDDIYAALAGPYVFQEIGFTSAVSLGSSEAAQDTILQLGFGLMAAWGAIGIVKAGCWMQVHEFNPEVLVDLGFTDPLLTFFQYTGLRTASGAKQAWPTLVGLLGGTLDTPMPIYAASYRRRRVA